MVKSPQRFAERVPHKSGRGSAPKPPLTAQRLRAVAPIVWELMRPRKKVLAFGFLLMAINRVSGLVLPYSTRYLIDSVVAKHHIELLKPIVFAVLTATVIQGITSFSLTQLLSKAAQRLITELREKVQRHISRLPVSFYDANKTGNLVSRIMTDVEGVRNLLGTGLVELAGGLLTSLIALVVLLRISALMTILAFGFLLCFAVVLNKAFSTIRPIFRERGKINAEVTGRLTESLGGVRVIKGYHAEEREEAVFAGGVRALARQCDAHAHRDFVDEPLGQFADGRGRRGHHVRRRAPDSCRHADGRRILYLHAVPRIPGCAHHSDRRHRNAVHRSFRRPRTHARDSARAPRRSGPAAHGGARRHRRATCDFDDVSFSYDGNERSARHFVRRRAGNGHGPCRFVGLRQVDHHRPDLRVSRANRGDGRWSTASTCRTVRLDSYRTRLGVVLQDSFLFDGTIRENVAFSRPDATEEEILRACQIARVDEFAESFEEKYDTIVGERGVKLSGGQRQRISIARAILADPRILILDEATSSLDSESEATDPARPLVPDAGAHNLRDRAPPLDHPPRRPDSGRGSGQIVERGTHEELYEMRGRYYDLYTKQHGLETNLFLAPGEGDAIVENGNGASAKSPPTRTRCA